MDGKGKEKILKVLKLKDAEGNPVLLTLAVEWILDNARPEEITAIPREDFERRVAASFAYVPAPLHYHNQIV